MVNWFECGARTLTTEGTEKWAALVDWFQVQHKIPGAYGQVCKSPAFAGCYFVDFVFKWFGAEKEEAEEVPCYQRGKGGVARGAGDASAGEARREQEARPERQAQTQPGKAAGRCGPRLGNREPSRLKAIRG